MTAMVMESNRNSRMLMERSLGTILEIVRHMAYYVAPWQNTDLELEAAHAVLNAVGAASTMAIDRIGEFDSIFGDAIKEAHANPRPSTLAEFAKDFDLTHNSHLAQTLAVALRSLAKSVREEPAYLA